MTARVGPFVWNPIALDGGWLLIGSEDRRAAVWISDDATSWQAVGPIDPPPVDNPDGWSVAEWWLDVVVPHGGRLIGLGWEHVGPADGSQIALWSSDDGRSWANVPTRDSSIDTYEVPADAVVAPDGTLIVAAIGGLGSSTTIWTTADGATWEAHQFSGVGDSVTVNAMATSGQMLLAVGMGPGVWTSSDGRTWTPHARPPGADEWLSDVAYHAASGRFAVVGRRTDGRAGVWFTRDGRSWSSAVISDGPGSALHVSVGGSVIAIGGSVGAQADQDATVWTSHDGVTWRYLPLASAASVRGLATGSDGTTVATLLSWQGDAQSEAAEVWTGRLPAD